MVEVVATDDGLMVHGVVAASHLYSIERIAWVTKGFPTLSVPHERSE